MPCYLTIVVVGNIIAPFFMPTDRLYSLSVYVHGAIRLLLALLLMFYFLPRLKGVALVWMWRTGLTGNETQCVEAGE